MITKAIASERVKILTTRSPYWCLGLVVVLGLGFAAIVGAGVRSSSSTSDVGSSVFSAGVTQFGIVVLMIMAILSITSEFRFGTIRTTFQAIPQRESVLLAKAIVYGGIAAAFTAVLNVLTLLIGKSLAGKVISVDLASSDVIRHYWGVPLYAFLCVIIGIGVGAIIRQTAGAIVVTLVWMLVIESILGTVPKVSTAVGPFLPFANAGRFLSDSSSSGAINDSSSFHYHWGPYGSLAYFALVALVIFCLGVWSTKRRDA